MGTILASTLITSVSRLLHDTANERWSTTELLEYLNDGQKEACIPKPDIYTVATSFQLAAGTRQQIPANSVQLVKIVRNMGLDGTTPGSAIPSVVMQQLDLVRPGWHSEAASAVVKHWMYDEKAPKFFWVYPRNTGTGYVEAILGAVPPDVAAVSNAITIDDIYKNPLVNYMLFRSYSKDADFAANESLAKTYYDLFMSSLMTKEGREKADRPQAGGADAE
jgi:hypothetical protein